MLSPNQRTLRAKIGAAEMHARNDPRAVTAAATAASQAALDLRLLSEIDPDGSLSPSERERRLGHARKAHYLRLAFQSSKARAATRG